MAEFTLTKTETSVLTEAAAREGGLVILPEGTKLATGQRLLGKLLKHDLIIRSERDGSEAHVLTRAGYEAVGLKAPSIARETKQAMILDLLGRGEGATVGELMAATGWLPHTTRAALSRIRSAGRTLAKSPRPDGATSYRLEPEVPAQVEPKRKRRAAPAEASAEA